LRHVFEVVEQPSIGEFAVVADVVNADQRLFDRAAEFAGVGDIELLLVWLAKPVRTGENRLDSRSLRIFGDGQDGAVAGAAAQVVSKSVGDKIGAV
jgi:hypothetical protein